VRSGRLDEVLSGVDRLRQERGVGGELCGGVAGAAARIPRRGGRFAGTPRRLDGRGDALVGSLLGALALAPAVRLLAARRSAVCPPPRRIRRDRAAALRAGPRGWLRHVTQP
jgi:hypothetical protein